jgi:hypothetical protein
MSNELNNKLNFLYSLLGLKLKTIYDAHIDWQYRSKLINFWKKKNIAKSSHEKYKPYNIKYKQCFKWQFWAITSIGL